MPSSPKNEIPWVLKRENNRLLRVSLREAENNRQRELVQLTHDIALQYYETILEHRRAHQKEMPSPPMQT